MVKVHELKPYLGHQILFLASLCYLVSFTNIFITLHLYGKYSPKSSKHLNTPLKVLKSTTFIIPF